MNQTEACAPYTTRLWIRQPVANKTAVNNLEALGTVEEGVPAWYTGHTGLACTAHRDGSRWWVRRWLFPSGCRAGRRSSRALTARPLIGPCLLGRHGLKDAKRSSAYMLEKTYNYVNPVIFLFSEPSTVLIMVDFATHSVWVV